MGARYIDLPGSSVASSYCRRMTRSECCLVLATLMLGTLVWLNMWPQQPQNRPPECPIVTAPPTVAAPKFEYRGVVESMDGVGFEFEKSRDITLDPNFESFYSLPKCEVMKWNPNPAVDVAKVMAEFRECITAHIDSYKDVRELWKIEHSWEANTTVCEEKLDLSGLKIAEFKNQHESKWAVMPKCQEQHMMVTLGVGHEVSAERQLNRTLPNVTFYGADPIIEPNIQLYSEFGRFFPFAVGRVSGTDNFRVLPNQNQRTREYVYQDVTTIEVVYVLKEIMKLSWIDFFWVDIEGGEIDFLDYFYKGGKLDENGITVCQFNAELHPNYVKEGPRKFYEFVDRLAKDGRYLFFKARTTGVGVYRMFFLNMEDPRCLKKFIL